MDYGQEGEQVSALLLSIRNINSEITEEEREIDKYASAASGTKGFCDVAALGGQSKIFYVSLDGCKPEQDNSGAPERRKVDEKL